MSPIHTPCRGGVAVRIRRPALPILRLIHCHQTTLHKSIAVAVRRRGAWIASPGTSRGVRLALTCMDAAPAGRVYVTAHGAPRRAGLGLGLSQGAARDTPVPSPCPLPHVPAPCPRPCPPFNGCNSACEGHLQPPSMAPAPGAGPPRGRAPATPPLLPPRAALTPDESSRTKITPVDDPVVS